MSEQAQRGVGIDVSQATLDVAVYPDGERWQVSNDEAGMTELVARLAAGGCLRPCMCEERSASVVERDGARQIVFALGPEAVRQPGVASHWSTRARTVARATARRGQPESARTGQRGHIQRAGDA